MLRHRLTLTLAALVTLAAGVACRDVAAPNEDPASTSYAPTLNVNLAQMKKTASGLYYQDLSVGTGKQAVKDSLAKVYYTLDAMGQAAKLSPEVFKAIHQQNVNLADKNKFFDWAASKGLDKKKVEEVFSSFGIDGKVKRAMQLAQEYHVEGVPTVIVDGKFMTSSDRVGTHANLPPALTELIAKARSERKS